MLLSNKILSIVEKKMFFVRPLIKVQTGVTARVTETPIISSSGERQRAGNSTNWWPTNSIGPLTGIPLDYNWTTGEKEAGNDICSRFSTPGTFLRKLRPEFRAPYQAAIFCVSTSMREEFPVADENRLLNLIPFQPHFSNVPSSLFFFFAIEQLSLPDFVELFQLRKFPKRGKHTCRVRPRRSLEERSRRSSLTYSASSGLHIRNVVRKIQSFPRVGSGYRMAGM